MPLSTPLAAARCLARLLSTLSLSCLTPTRVSFTMPSTLAAMLVAARAALQRALPAAMEAPLDRVRLLQAALAHLIVLLAPTAVTTRVQAPLLPPLTRAAAATLRPLPQTQRLLPLMPAPLPMMTARKRVMPLTAKPTPSPATLPPPPPLTLLPPTRLSHLARPCWEA